MLEKEKTIWIINQYASHLETRHLELAKVFSENGYRVVVFTSSFHHGKREYLFDESVHFSERSKNVFYVYLHSSPAYYGNGGQRVLNMLDFCRRFSAAEKSIAEKIGAPAFVIGSSAHPFVWESAYSCAKRYHAKFIAEFRDIWPLSLVEVQGVSPKHPFVKLLGIIEKRAYRRADLIVSTVEFAYKHVCKVSEVPKEKVCWMPNGINTAEIDVHLASGTEIPSELAEYLDQHWCCVYTGSIAQCEHVDYLVEAFCYVSNPEIKLAIIGDGGQKEEIQKQISAYGLTNVRIFPSVDKDQVHAVLSKAGCCLMAAPDLPIYQYGLSINKLNDYLYSGKPVIFAYNADNMVKSAGHFGIPYGDPKAMAEMIKEVHTLTPKKLAELRESGRMLIREQYDMRAIAFNYLSKLEGILLGEADD